MIFYSLLLVLSISAIKKVNGQSANTDKGSFINFVEKRGSEVAPTYQKRNCVQFMDVILKEYLNIDNNTSARIYINYNLKFIKKLYNNGDTATISGVCAALVDCNKAQWIRIEDAKRGDIIQYWSDNGYLNGHCGIFWGKDSEGNFLLKGSHPDSNGYGIMNMYNKHNKMKIFCVRVMH